MSENICIQVGQCGNQVGSALYDTLYEDVERGGAGFPVFHDAARKRWFRENHRHQAVARAILIDCENKVLDGMKFVPGESTWCYDADNAVVHCGSGSANNWALGFNENGIQSGDHIINLIDREAELCDRLGSVLLLSSCSGGTGAGMGARIMERVRDGFPGKTLISSLVLPYSVGEVTVQNYNTVLSLDKFTDTCDLVFLFSNDYLNDLVTKVARLNCAGFEGVNSLLASQIAGLMQPTIELSSADHLAHLGSHPDLKLISFKSAPLSLEDSPLGGVPSWPSLLTHLKMSMVATNDLTYESRDPSRPVESRLSRQRSYHRSLNSVLICRGQESTQALAVTSEVFNDKNLFPRWHRLKDRLLVDSQPRPLLRIPKHALLAANSALVAPTLNALVERAWVSYNHGAYLHQYERYGLPKDHFISAFSKLEFMIKSYLEL